MEIRMMVNCQPLMTPVIRENTKVEMKKQSSPNFSPIPSWYLCRSLLTNVFIGNITI